MVWVEVFSSRHKKTWAYYTGAEVKCKRFFRSVTSVDTLMDV